ncbi:hypothetical protein SynBMKMC1_01571 [Synechococcus sp. BMK-MC-1]|nr:hypothetical protein SynBMKMC1_01571 [Synechococcus sp. BMK-MC-1]
MDLKGFVFIGLRLFWHGRADAPLNSTSSRQGHCDVKNQSRAFKNAEKSMLIEIA